jgi:NifU-like protein involved in Fe-S cluster formation
MSQRTIGTFTNRILDHFYNPRNVGIADGFNRSYLEQANPWLIRIRFTLRVDQGHIEDVKFQAQSCVTTTACCSALTEMIRHQSLETAISITPERLSEYLGTIPEDKMYCARLTIASLHHALESSTAGPPAKSNTLTGGSS